MNVKTFIWNGDNFFFIPDLSFSIALFLKHKTLTNLKLKNRFIFQVVKKMRKKLAIIHLRRAARKPFKKVITLPAA
jgi:hypothetical protein